MAEDKKILVESTEETIRIFPDVEQLEINSYNSMNKDFIANAGLITKTYTKENLYDNINYSLEDVEDISLSDIEHSKMEHQHSIFEEFLKRYFLGDLPLKNNSGYIKIKKDDYLNNKFENKEIEQDLSAHQFVYRFSGEIKMYIAPASDDKGEVIFFDVNKLDKKCVSLSHIKEEARQEQEIINNGDDIAPYFINLLKKYESGKLEENK